MRVISKLAEMPFPDNSATFINLPDHFAIGAALGLRARNAALYGGFFLIIQFGKGGIDGAVGKALGIVMLVGCLLYTSPSPRDS